MTCYLGLFCTCVGIRSTAVVAAYCTPYQWKPLWAIPAGISVVGNAIKMYRYDENQTGAFGQNVWWNYPGRLIHLLIMLLFVVMALTKNKYMWVAPALDIGYGVTNFTVHHLLQMCG
jgi:hypothetical protein